MRATTRQERQRLKTENKKYPSTHLFDVPRAEWPEMQHMPERVMRNSGFLVLQYPAPSPAVCRLSVCRTAIRAGRWADEITWDDLHLLKRWAGYGHLDAIEIYPADLDLVNVANMRHLWVMAEPHPLAWRKP